MLRCAVVIPALNPPQSLSDMVKRLLAGGVARVVVINDGSAAEKAGLFHELGMLEGCTVLTHEENRGKGRALKTAFAYVLKCDADWAGVVTADADGQHDVEDILNVASALVRLEEEMVLGVRDFSLSHVPWRSWFGNRLTSFIIQLFFGCSIQDTQTGLRGIPMKELKWMLELRGERFEYEMIVLINAIRRQVKVHQLPIQTIYFQRNAGSHFRSFADSFRILFLILSEFFRSLLRKDTSRETNGGKK